MTRRIHLPLIRAVGLRPAGLNGAQLEAKYSLQGRIIDDVTRQPILGAQLALRGGTLKLPAGGSSDGQGAFTFTDLAAGKDQLRVEKTGYFPLSFGEVGIGNVRETSLGDIVLTTKRRISGTVRWQDGDPPARGFVHAMFVSRGRAEVRSVNSKMALTDDRGRFRIEELQPGRYVLMTYAISAAEPVSKPRAAVPLFYPRLHSPDAGSSVDLRHSAEVTDLQFVLEETTGVQLEGRVLPSAPFPQGTRTGVGLTASGSPAQFIALQDVPAGETFRFSAIPTGSYVLIANATTDYGFVRAYRPIEVKGEGIRDIALPMPDISPIQVKVEIEELETQQPVTQGQLSRPSVKLTPAAGVRVQAEFAALGPYGVIQRNTNETGEAYLAAAAGQTYSFQLLTKPTGTYIAEVSQGGKAMPDGPWSITAGAGPVRVLLKKDGASVEGSVRDKVRIVQRSFVVLAPKMRDAVHRYRTAESDYSGSFKLTDVQPGEYQLFALPRNDEDQYLNEEYLQKLAAAATPVSVSPGSVLSVNAELARM